AMLDSFHTAFQRALYAGRGVRMNTDIGSPIGRCRDGSLHLGRRILKRVDRIVSGRHTAATHDLDLTGSEHKLLANAVQDLMIAISDNGYAGFLCQAEIGLRTARDLGAQAKIAVPGRLRDHGSRRIDARTRKTPFINRTLERE